MHRTPTHRRTWDDESQEVSLCSKKNGNPWQQGLFTRSSEWNSLTNWDILVLHIIQRCFWPVRFGTLWNSWNWGPNIKPQIILYRSLSKSPPFLYPQSWASIHLLESGWWPFREPPLLRHSAPVAFQRLPEWSDWSAPAQGAPKPQWSASWSHLPPPKQWPKQIMEKSWRNLGTSLMILRITIREFCNFLVLQ